MGKKEALMEFKVNWNVTAYSASIIFAKNCALNDKRGVVNEIQMLSSVNTFNKQWVYCQ